MKEYFTRATWYSGASQETNRRWGTYKGLPGTCVQHKGVKGLLGVHAYTSINIYSTL